MANKSESLSFPADPLAALRALQDLDAPASPPAAGSEGGNATGSAVAKKPAARRERGGPEGEAKRSGNASDLLGDAVRELLARPYADEGSKVSVTVSTVKIPTEVWERLGWVAALTGRTKQDLIAEALKDYFRCVLKDR